MSAETERQLEEERQAKRERQMKGDMQRKLQVISFILTPKVANAISSSRAARIILSKEELVKLDLAQSFE